MTVQEKLDLLLEQMGDIKEEILEIKKSQEELPAHWKDTKDEIVFKDSSSELSVRCNNVSWKDYKKNGSSYTCPLFMVMNEDRNGSYIGLKLEDMVKLRNYLTQKIDYLKLDDK